MSTNEEEINLSLDQDPLAAAASRHRRHRTSDAALGLMPDTADPAASPGAAASPRPSDKRASFSRRNSLSMRREKLTDINDPLSLMGNDFDHFLQEVDCLTLTSSDELRVINSITETAKKRVIGCVSSVCIDFSPTGSLRLGVKDLHGGVLVVSVLKRPENCIGPGELSGVKIGDVILGVNFNACRDGSKTLLKTVKQLNNDKINFLTLQIWRCQSICSDLSPGNLFPKVDDMVIQSFTLFRNKMLSDWERSNFLENILAYMKLDLEITTKIAILKSQKDQESMIPLLKDRRAQDNLVLDLERNIFQAKGLRPALSVRIVHTKLAMGDSSNAVVYVLRVEDVESGLQWAAQWRYRDFFQLHQELCEMSYFTKEIPFPKKRLMGLSHVVEERIVALEEFVRTAVHVLTCNASLDPGASKALRHIQTFLGVGRYLDCIKPPKMDDQRCIELMTYKHLNDLNSPSCQHCKRFVATVDLNSKVLPGPLGYKPVLDFLCEALQEVEQFTLQHHGQLMTQVLRDRRTDLEENQVKAFVRRCVRRQVEAAVYLPLRRAVLRIVYSFIAKKAERLHKAIEHLRHLSPTYFFLDEAVSQCKSLPVAAKAFRDLVQAYLPADQGQLLIKAAITVMVVQTECMGLVSSREARAKAEGSAAAASPSASGDNAGLLTRESSRLKLLDLNTIADPAGTLMSNMDVSVSKSNLETIDVNKLQRQASTGFFNDEEEAENADAKAATAAAAAAVVAEEARRTEKRAVSAPVVQTAQWHDLVGALTESAPGGHGLKSFPSAFADQNSPIASAELQKASIFDDPSLTHNPVLTTKDKEVGVGEITETKPEAEPSEALGHAAVSPAAKSAPVGDLDAQIPERGDEYLASEYSAEAADLLADNYGDDAVEGAKVQFSHGVAATQDVLGSNSVSESVSQEVDAMRRRTNTAMSSKGDRMSSDAACDMLPDSEDPVEKSAGFYDNIDHDAVVSADDFLPMFTYVLVSSILFVYG
jgi:hypothetical protein